MGLVGRLKLGIALTKDSIILLKDNPSLLVFPAVGGIAALIYMIVFFGITLGFYAIDLTAGAAVMLFLIYFGTTFISSFFAAGLVHQTRKVIRGEGDPSLREGVNAAWEVRKPLAIWSVIAATVSILINALENSDSRAAQIFGTLFGVAWTLMTFFVIPVIVFEKTSTKGMFKRSAGTFKEMWGETPVSMIGVQLFTILIAITFVVLGFLFLVIHPAITILTIFLGILAAFLIGQALQGIIKTVMYLYATEGLRPEEFDDIDFDGMNQV